MTRFKYVVSCVLQQNTGGATAASMVGRACAVFDENDGMVSRELCINDMYICVTIFGVLIY